MTYMYSVAVHGELPQHGLAVGVDDGGGACDGDGRMVGGEDGWVAGSSQNQNYSNSMQDSNCNHLE